MWAGTGMAVSEFTRDRAMHPAQLAGGAFEAWRQKSRARAAVETLLTLVLIALGVFMLRLVLVLALGAPG
jgi:hypothetical protein